MAMQVDPGNNKTHFANGYLILSLPFLNFSWRNFRHQHLPVSDLLDPTKDGG